MINHILKLMLVGAVVVGLISGLAFVALAPRSQGQEENTPSNITIVQHSSYIELTREEMIDQADIIFLGKVVNISPTRWNQDSGKPWYDEGGDVGLQLHHIEFEVLRPIVGNFGLDKRVTITALGSSPLDSHQEGEQAIIQGGPDHDLKLGDETVIFVRQTDLAWRDGTRSILELMGNPADAHLIRGDDGLYHGRWTEGPVSLDELINRIAQRRETLVQP